MKTVYIHVFYLKGLYSAVGFTPVTYRKGFFFVYPVSIPPVRMLFHFIFNNGFV